MLLSITIITYNCRELLRSCLESIQDKISAENITFELILVDNNSIDGTFDMIQRDFGDLNAVMIRNPENYGVARARNQALKASRGKYVLILDADTKILSPGLSSVLDYMDRNSDTAILGCRMLDKDDKLYPSARTFPGPREALVRRLSHYGLFKDSDVLRKHHVQLCNNEDPIEVDYVIGAFQLIRRNAIEMVGLLDEKMFYGFEDADYCVRMKRQGFNVVYYPAFSIKHYVQGITKKGVFNKMLFFHIKSYIRLLRKYYFLF